MVQKKADKTCLRALVTLWHVECRGRTHGECRYEVLTYYQGLLKVQFVCDFDLENYHNKANILSFCIDH